MKVNMLIRNVFCFVLMFIHSMTGIASANDNPQLSTMEQRISKLENQSFALKTFIKRISKQMFQKNFELKKSKLKLIHKNKMGGAFRIVELRYILDGKEIYKTSSSLSNSVSKNKKVYESEIKPGLHNVKIFAKIKGFGFGIFTYMKKYRTTLRDNLQIVVQKNKELSVNIVFSDRGGRDINKRVQVKFIKKEK